MYEELARKQIEELYERIRQLQEINRLGKRKEVQKEGIKGCENQAKNLDSDGGKEISIVNNDKEIWKRKKFRKNRPPRGIRNGEGSGTPTNSEGNQRRRQFNKGKYNERPKNQGKREFL